MTLLPSQDPAILSLAQAALRQYPLRDPSLRFLGHSDNLTFRVEEPTGAAYLLRLHQPVLDYWAGPRQQPEAIASELAWIEALALEGGFYLQRPIRTSEGELVASVWEKGGQPLPVTLLTWLEGVHFSPATPDAPALIERFGELVGRMHDFSAGWQPPAGFTRPSYDYRHFNQIFARLLRGVSLGVFSEEIYWSLRATCRAILEEIDRLPAGSEHWGMIHADLHVGNFLVQGGQIIPIDFSFCGMGHYLFDLSVCLAGGLKGLLRPAFLKGYRTVRALPESDLRAVCAYALAGTFSYFSYQIDNPTERAWLQRRIPEILQGTCLRFLRGETVIWDM